MTQYIRNSSNKWLLWLLCLLSFRSRSLVKTLGSHMALFAASDASTLLAEDLNLLRGKLRFSLEPLLSRSPSAFKARILFYQISKNLSFLFLKHFCS